MSNNLITSIHYLFYFGEFSNCVDTENLRLPATGVCVIWKWNWLTAASGIQSGDEIESGDEETKTDNSDSDAEEDLVNEQPDTNTLVFKCMGCHKETRYQKALEKVRDLMAEGKSVPVAIVHEKTNIYDARALAFVCQLDNKPYTIGYAVSELLDEMHMAIGAGNISVSFSWVKYITDWTRCGPNFLRELLLKGKDHGHLRRLDLPALGRC